MLATAWTTKRRGAPGAANTAPTPSGKCAARYVSSAVSSARLAGEKPHKLIGATTVPHIHSPERLGISIGLDGLWVRGFLRWRDHPPCMTIRDTRATHQRQMVKLEARLGPGIQEPLLARACVFGSDARRLADDGLQHMGRLRFQYTPHLVSRGGTHLVPLVGDVDDDELREVVLPQRRDEALLEERVVGDYGAHI